MKKLMIILVFAALISSCCEQKEKKGKIFRPEKPFIIYDMYPWNNPKHNNYRYDYYDMNGMEFWFIDIKGKYSIGDTIK